MNAATLPVICSSALALMSAAGFGEWSRTCGLVQAAKSGLIASKPATIPENPLTPAQAPLPPEAEKPAPSPPAAASQKQFYEALLAKMQGLENENKELKNQVAETNRDVMQLGFRVDTHSSQFRPLPGTDNFRTLNTGTEFLNGTGASPQDDLGVLPPIPPRAEPVFLPDGE